MDNCKQRTIKRDRSSILAEEREARQKEKQNSSCESKPRKRPTVARYIGKCPYCKEGKVEARKVDLKTGKKCEIYTCSNGKWVTEDGEMFENIGECDFRIWQNALSKYGHWLKHSEVRALLNQEDVIVKFLSIKRGFDSKRKEYKKYIALDEEYGVTVLFDIDVDEEDANKRD